MKNIIVLITFILSLIQCTTTKNEKYFDGNYLVTNAEFYQIEDKEKFLIYHIKNDTLDGIFAQKKECGKPALWKKIKLNKKYRLILEKPEEHSRSNVSVRENEYMEGTLIWNSDMRSSFFLKCSNVCGDKIYEVQ